MRVQEYPKSVNKKEVARSISGAEAVIRSLLAEGVDLIFGYPGGANMPIYDELYKFQDRVQHILTRHEQGAVHAAQGYARAGEKPGVVMATSGPGATNLVTGIADANIDSTPVVCITGQVAAHLLGSDAFQETDIIGITTPVTKWNHQITRASEIQDVIAKAFFIAKSGRPGPVHIDITKNALFEHCAFNYKKCEEIRSYQPIPELQEDQLEKAVELINAAQKPLVVFGQGVILSKAEEVFRLFIEKTGTPAAATVLGLSALSNSHAQYVGMVGMHGNYAPNMLTNECDVLIAVGMRFDDRVTGNLDSYAKQAKVIHFEIDPSEVDKNVKTDVAVIGDAREAMEAIMPLLEKKSHEAWLKRFRELEAKEFKEVIKDDIHPTKEGLTMGEVVHRLNDLTQGEAIIVSDVGQHQMITCRYSKFQRSKSKITSGGLGTMGFGLPAAIGAKLADPEREVIAILGDGGFQMNIQELGTIFQSDIPVKIIVLNNNFLGMVRQWQQLFFDKRYASTEMKNPDFVSIVKGYQINAEKIDKREQLDRALLNLVKAEGASFVEVVVEKEDNVFPMIPSGASVSEIRLS